MTVHAAKGLEFEHVFVLRLTHRGFPMAPRTSVLEFPEALMKEELPKGDFHVQEERRLFYVALTRARERLTLTTVLHKRSKPSVFLDDILSAPQLTRQHVQQLAPGPAGLARPPRLPASTFLFPEARLRARVYSRIGEWAETYRPPVFEPLRLSASAMDSYRNCPQKYLFGAVWGIPGGPRAATTFGNVMHTTIKQFIEALRKGRRLPFDEVETIFRREWSSAGFEDTYQEECYQRDGIEQLRAFYASCLESPPDVIAQEKRFTMELENNVQITGRMDQINRLGPGRGGDRGLQDREAEDGRARAERFATGHLRAGGARGTGARARAAGLLQPGNQRVRGRDARRQAARGGARHDPGSGRRHSRARVSRAAGIPVPDVRISLYLSRARGATRPGEESEAIGPAATSATPAAAAQK